MKTSSYNDYLLFALITRLDVKPDRIVDVLNSQIQRLPHHHNQRDHHHHHLHLPHKHNKQVRNCRLAEKRNQSVKMNHGGDRSICSICFDLKMERDMFRGGDCNHPVCAECISKHVVDHIQRNVFVVDCPIPACCVELKPGNFHGLLPKGVVVRWESAISGLLGKNYYCHFRSLPVLWEDEGEGEVVKEVKQEKDLDRKVLKLAKTKMTKKRCPKCSVYEQRSGGFEHLTCRCGCHFCYNCGGKWKLGHKCNIFQRWQNNWKQLVRQISRKL